MAENIKPEVQWGCRFYLPCNCSEFDLWWKSWISNIPDISNFCWYQHHGTGDTWHFLSIVVMGFLMSMSLHNYFPYIPPCICLQFDLLKNFSYVQKIWLASEKLIWELTRFSTWRCEIWATGNKLIDIYVYRTICLKNA